MNSTRYAIVQAVFETVQTVAADQNSDALIRPRLPIDTKGRKTRILFVLDRGDKLLEQPGQNEKRRARVVVGALVLPSVADADADEAVDALHFAVRAAIKRMRRQLAAVNERPALFREVELEPELKETVADGALLLSAYEIDYHEIYPAA